jgi:hypothetical protein
LGLPGPALIRKILDQTSLEAAEKCIENNRPSGGRSFLLSDRSQAIGFEVTGKQIKSFGKISNRPSATQTITHADLKDTEDLESRSKSTFDRLEKDHVAFRKSIKFKITS